MARGDVLRTFDAPGNVISGLAWDGQALWVNDLQHNVIVQISPVDGTVLRSLAQLQINHTGSAWDGRTLWLRNTSNTVLYHQVSVIDGSELRVVNGQASIVNGFAWDGRRLYYATPVDSDFDDSDEIFLMDPIDGTILRTLKTGVFLPQGVEVGPDVLWISGPGSIHAIDPLDGTEKYSFDSPTGFPGELAFDGRCLWIIDNTGDTISQVSLT